MYVIARIPDTAIIQFRHCITFLSTLKEVPYITEVFLLIPFCQTELGCMRRYA